MLVGLAPKVELEIQEARELWFPRNGRGASPGKATWPKSPSPPCSGACACRWGQCGSYLPQQVGVVLHQLAVLLL